ncbi:MAG TPA: radical SAM protein [Bacteroidales bacterium]|nr:radical SAM protein [Bacteroidales bacterium]HOH84758.1 radical SAM protein [Bacteroidales bacterium]
MLDSYKREINYLRVSVTDRCNLRCTYCMPADGVSLMRHEDILSFEEISDIVKVAVSKGISKVRITGGEPLVRRGIISLIEQIAIIPGILDLSMTTNGILLEEYAGQLAKAGIQRVNISLDTVDPQKYAEITRGGDIQKVVRGIAAAKKAGLSPIKINCVVKNSSNEPDALGVKDFCEKNGLQVRFIQLMDLEKGHFSVVDGGSGGDCAICNRLRLTADGKIKPCLFNDIEFDVRTMGAEKAIAEAIKAKPECGTFNKNGRFNNIGG